MKVLIIILEWIKAHPEIVTTQLAVLWEIIFRVKPTEKDWSIINLIKRILDKIFKNKKTIGGCHL